MGQLVRADNCLTNHHYQSYIRQAEYAGITRSQHATNVTSQLCQSDKVVEMWNTRDKCFHGRGRIFPASAANTRHGTERSLAAWSSRTTWRHGPSAGQHTLSSTWLLHDCPAYSIIHCDAEKMNQFSFVCILFNAWQKLVNYFLHNHPLELIHNGWQNVSSN